MDPDQDADPAPSVSDLQDPNKKCKKFSDFFCVLLLETTFTSFFTDKKIIKKSQNM
jgi:hypothetical protein